MRRCAGRRGAPICATCVQVCAAPWGTHADGRGSPSPPTPHPHHVQSYLGDALDTRVASVLAANPNIKQLIEGQGAGLGDPPARAAPTPNIPGIIAGTIVGFFVLAAMTVAATVILYRRRRAARAASTAAHYAPAPVGEGAERAALAAPRPRAAAALPTGLGSPSAP